MNKPMQTINVVYKQIDGAHFFVSDDKQVAGLCVAHNDMEVAYEEVGHQLSALIKFNEGEDITFRPAMEFKRFKKIVEAYDAVRRIVDEDDVVTPSTIQPWLYSAPQHRIKEPA